MEVIFSSTGQKELKEKNKPKSIFFKYYQEDLVPNQNVNIVRFFERENGVSVTEQLSPNIRGIGAKQSGNNKGNFTEAALHWS